MDRGSSEQKVGIEAIGHIAFPPMNLAIVYLLIHGLI